MASIYIYGSCVSRDAFDYLDKAGNELLGYTARQSLISAVNKPYAADAASGELSSPFQIRNLQGDFDGDLSQTLIDVADRADYVFWDLTDERLGVIEVSDATYITRSTELVQSAILNDEADHNWIKFGSDRHLALWKQAVIRFADFVKANDLESKVVLFNIPWSMHDDEGEALGRYWAMLPDEANNLFARYIAVIREHLDVFCLDLPWQSTVSNRQHKWSLAPYHYMDGVYHALANRLAERQGQVATQPGLRAVDDDASGSGTWYDAVDAPLRAEVSPGASYVGIQFEAQSRLPQGHHLLISLELQGAGDTDLSACRISKSGHESIGYFRYVEVDAGQRSYFASFALPAGVTCTSISVVGWHVASGSVDLRGLTAFATRNDPGHQIADDGGQAPEDNPSPPQPSGDTYSNALVLTTRFSLFLPQNAAWYASNGSRFPSADDYAAYLYSPERLDPRMEIFTGMSLPAIALIAERHLVLHRVQYSRALPLKYLEQLQVAEEQYPFMQLELVDEEGNPSKPEMIREFISRAAQSSNIVFGDARLDDDDVLSGDFFDLCSRYLTRDHVGYAISLAKGLTGLFENGKVTSLRRVVHPKIAIGLMTVGYFDARTGTIQQTFIGSHPTVDERMPVILDSTAPSYLWMRHLEQDSVLQLDPSQARKIVEHSLSRYEPQAADSSVVGAFPTVPFDGLQPN
jgi:hypothetical protein